MTLGDSIKLQEKSANAELAVYLGDVRSLLQLTKFLGTLRRVFAAYKGSRPFRWAALPGPLPAPPGGGTAAACTPPSCSCSPPIARPQGLVASHATP